MSLSFTPAITRSLDAFMRLIDFGAVAAFFVLAFLWLGGVGRPAHVAELAGWLAISLVVCVPDA